MKPAQQYLSFFACLVVAFFIAIGCASVHALLWPSFLSGFSAIRLVAAIAGVAYIGFCLAKAGKQGGVLVTSIAGVASITLAFLVAPGLHWIAFAVAGSIWAVRTVAFHRSIAVATADALLLLVSGGVMLMAWTKTHSVFLTIWSGALVQCFLPLVGKKTENNTVANTRGRVAHNQEDRFERAFSAAEAALKNIANR